MTDATTPRTIHTVAVIAAGGKSGLQVVAALLAAGYRVRAGVHHPSSRLPVHPQLIQVACDATRPLDVANLLHETEAVVSLIGHVRGSRADVQTAATRVIIAAMKDAHLRRFISLSGTGIRETGDKITLMDRLLNGAILVIDHSRVADGIAHARLLSASNLDYTIVRVLKLTNGRAQAYTLREHGPVQTFTARATVAAAVVRVLADGSFIAASPIIGSPVKP